MPLSEYEKRVLEQMERQLMSDDPKLATTMTEPHAPKSLQKILVTATGVLIGAAILVAGAVIRIPLIGVLGFVVMFVAVMYGIAGDKPETAAEAAAQEKPAKTSGWYESLNDRWDRRQRG